MKQLFGYCLFLLYFSVITVNSAKDVPHSGRPDVGGCKWENVTEEALKKDKDLRDGRQHILDAEKKTFTPMGTNSSAYNVTVYILDLQVCKQLVSGYNYHFYWTKEFAIVKCLDKRYCDPTHVTTLPKNWNCTASYWVEPWAKHYEFKGPGCFL